MTFIKCTDRDNKLLSEHFFPAIPYASPQQQQQQLWLPPLLLPRLHQPAARPPTPQVPHLRQGAEGKEPHPPKVQRPKARPKGQRPKDEEELQPKAPGRAVLLLRLLPGALTPHKEAVDKGEELRKVEQLVEVVLQVEMQPLCMVIGMLVSFALVALTMFRMSWLPPKESPARNC